MTSIRQTINALIPSRMPDRKLVAENERLRIEGNLLFNGLVYIVNVASGEAQRHGLKILRQYHENREALKEPDDA